MGKNEEELESLRKVACVGALLHEAEEVKSLIKNRIPILSDFRL
jgi:hypothetical protein